MSSVFLVAYCSASSTSLSCRHPADVKKEKEDILKRLNAKVTFVLLCCLIFVTFLSAHYQKLERRGKSKKLLH